MVNTCTLVLRTRYLAVHLDYFLNMLICCSMFLFTKKIQQFYPLVFEQRLVGNLISSTISCQTKNKYLNVRWKKSTLYYKKQIRSAFWLGQTLIVIPKVLQEFEQYFILNMIHQWCSNLQKRGETDTYTNIRASAFCQPLGYCTSKKNRELTTLLPWLLPRNKQTEH